MKQTYLLLAIPILAISLFGAGCEEMASSSSSDTQASEQAQVQAIHDKQAVAVPIPKLDNSLERVNISKRLSIFDDPNKVSYIYLVNYGRVMAFYTIKGKVTSGNKRLTSTQQQTSGKFENPCQSVSCGYNKTMVMEAPELDGTYGNSNPYIFFWTTDGVYVQWTGDYMLVDQPLKLATQPELTREIK